MLKLSHIVAAVWAICVTPLSVWAESPVVIISDQVSPAFEATRSSLQDELENLGYRKIVAIHTDNARAKLLGETPRLVFALGSHAAETAVDLFQDSLVVASMVLAASLTNRSPRMAAVTLDAPVLEQLNWHARMLPDVRRIGILFDPAKSQEVVDEAKSAAVALNLEIVAIPVSNPAVLPSALKSAARRADSILSIPDTTIYSGKTAQAVLLFSFRNKMPLIGLSSNWVKAGALYGLEVDYTELGRQCAELGKALLERKDAAKTAHAKKFVYHVNLKTAEHLKIQMSPKLLAQAHKVYQ